MAEQLTLIDFIRELLGLEGESKAIELRDYFEKDPQAALAEYGLGHLSPEDVEDAIVLYQDNDTVSFDRNYDTGFSGIGSAGAHAAGGHLTGGHVETVATSHVVNNHIDDRDTILDQSVNQNVDTDGGDFRQTIDNDSVNATGDGSVAAGDDIEDSPITHGNGNVVGDDNEAVTGNDNATAFGSGSAQSDVSADNGGAVSGDGDATGDASVDNSHNRDWSEDNDTTTTTNSGNSEIDNSIDNSVEDNDGLDIDVTL